MAEGELELVMSSEDCTIEEIDKTTQTDFDCDLENMVQEEVVEDGEIQQVVITSFRPGHSGKVAVKTSTAGGIEKILRERTKLRLKKLQHPAFHGIDMVGSVLNVTVANSQKRQKSGDEEEDSNECVPDSSQDEDATVIKIIAKKMESEDGTSEEQILLDEQVKSENSVFRNAVVNTYKCTMCKKEFQAHSLYQLHLKQHLDTKNGNLTCLMCDKVFKRRKDLLEHEKTHEPTNGRFPCKDCDRVYQSKGALSAHAKKHLNIDHVCEICGKHFKNHTSLHWHIKQHEGHRYKCEVCDKLFLDRCSIYRHMRLHRGEKPHVCEICGHAFAVQGNLRDHMKTHEEKPATQVKAFGCPFCDADYVHRSGLYKHIKKKHNINHFTFKEG